MGSEHPLCTRPLADWVTQEEKPVPALATGKSTRPLHLLPAQGEISASLHPSSTLQSESLEGVYFEFSTHGWVAFIQG